MHIARHDVLIVSSDGGSLPHLPRTFYGDCVSVVRSSRDEDSHGVYGQYGEVGKPAGKPAPVCHRQQLFIGVE